MPKTVSSSDAIVERLLERARPEPILLVSEWSDRHRVLPSKGASEPGPWRTSRTPYLKEILDSLSTGSPYHTVVFAKGSQVGASEAGLNWLAYCIHHAPAPMLMVQPTVEMVKRISKQRIQPMIDVTPVLSERIADSRARDAGNTLFQKDFPAGTFIMTGANSATGLRSMPARYLFLDEVDAYPGDVEGEGDPVELAIARTSTFKRNRKIYIVSTPTIQHQSRIWTAFEATDQRYYHVPCPDCGHYQVIEWTRIVWEPGKPDTASLACADCGVLIPERQKGGMLAKGEWRAKAETNDPHVVGFHLSSLYSPPGWYSWGDAVKDFLKAKDAPELLKSFVNTKLGECYEDRTGEKIDETGLMARRELWEGIPDDVLLLTSGVDIQKDRIEVSVIGWTAKEQARVVQHLRLMGSPSEPAVWSDLDDVLLETWRTESDRYLTIRAACIDSGGHHTEQVYQFCGTRGGRRVLAIKGRAGQYPIWPTKLSKVKLKHGAALHLVGVDTAKDHIHTALSVLDTSLPRYVAFSQNLPEDYFSQLVAERRVTKYGANGTAVRSWVKKPGDRNEALDCFVYALAGLKALQAGNANLLRRMRPQFVEPRPKASTAPPMPQTLRKPAVRRTSSAIL